MATKISNIAELFHRFHHCEMQLKQGKIAACLITFKEVIEKSPFIPKTEKEKRELNGGIEMFLSNLSRHKKFQEIFGVISFGDSDLETNLEFIKSMIIAQEEDIVERIKIDEDAAEVQRLEIDKEKQKKNQEMREKIIQAIGYLDQDNLPQAMEIISESDDIREAVANHYNDVGMQHRTDNSFEEAVKNYSKALTVSPEDENILYNIGRACFEAGDSHKAEDFLAKAMKLNPGFAEGQLFYDYLLKLNSPQAEPAENENKSEGFFKKMFHWKRS
jgi:tetratricopeptide (TPR) repeat protein